MVVCAFFWGALNIGFEDVNKGSRLVSDSLEKRSPMTKSIHFSYNLN